MTKFQKYILQFAGGALITFVIPIIGLVVLGFTVYELSNERVRDD